MDPAQFDRLARRLGARLSRRNVLTGAGLLATAAMSATPVRALAQTPETETAQPVLALRSYIVLGSVTDVASALPALILHMEEQPGFLDYRVAELAESTIATMSSFLGQEASDNAAMAEAEWIAVQMSDLLTEPVDSITGNLLSWSGIGAGMVCQTQFADSCAGHGLTCCPTTARTESPGICVNAATTCPAVLPDASPAAACKDEGCLCSTGTQFPCNDDLSCCPENEETPPGGPGTCQATCDD